MPPEQPDKSAMLLQVLQSIDEMKNKISSLEDSLTSKISRIEANHVEIKQKLEAA